LNLIRNYEQIKNNLETKKELVVDARAVDAFNAGHIPEAISCPYSELFDIETKALKSSQKLTECNFKYFFY
jgi:3-mercaptopyruvate sulfurtransferase SseA